MAEQDSRSKVPHEGDALLIESRIEAVEREQKEEKKRDDEYKQRQLRFNKWLVILTGGLVIAAVVGNSISIYQSVESKRAADSASRSADAASKAASTADAALSESQKSFQIDQRPYVITDGPTQFVVAPNALGKRIEANVIFKDIGRTPAIDTVWLVDLLPYRAKTRPEYLSFVDGSFINLKKRQEVTIEKHNAEMSRDIVPTATTFTSENARTLSPSEMADLEKGDGSFILLSIGIVSYTDALKGNYETEFCYFFVGANPNVWHICDSHNTIK